MTGAPERLRKRLIPLYAAAFLQAFALWVPIEKLFMITIGFDAASVGLMAAVYGAVVPVLEVPSGVLADRWSRRGVLLLASLAAVLAVLIGGFSHSVAAYTVSAAFLGVFFALQSGTFESIVYDTVLEETGDSDSFEKTMGRVRLVESAALVTGAIAGAVIAEIASLRATYFLTAPLILGSTVALLLFREPQLHKAEDPQSLRHQIATTFRTIMARGHLRAIVALTIAGSILVQGMLEFGPLWLVALVVPAVLYGPQWAGLSSALGLGGLLGSQGWFTQTWVVRLAAGVIVGSCVSLAFLDLPLVVIGVQVVLTLLVVAVSIPVLRRLHDSVPSAIRAGVASGVGTLTWLAFVPFALVFGFVSERAGVDRAAWFIVAIGIAVAFLMLIVLPHAPPVIAAETIVAAREPGPTFPADRFLPADHPVAPGHWAVSPAAWSDLGERVEASDTMEVARAAIEEMPVPLRRVIVLRDIEGGAPDDVREALGLGPEEERALLQQARGLVRARLEQHFEGTGDDDES